MRKIEKPRKTGVSGGAATFDLDPVTPANSDRVVDMGIRGLIPYKL